MVKSEHIARSADWQQLRRVSIDILVVERRSSDRTNFVEIKKSEVEWHKRELRLVGDLHISRCLNLWSITTFSSNAALQGVLSRSSMHSCMFSFFRQDERSFLEFSGYRIDSQVKR